MKIYKNLWAGYETYFIKTSSNGKFSYGYVIVNVDGKWTINKGSFYSSDLKHDNEHFPVVGNINLDKVIIDAVLKEIRK